MCVCSSQHLLDFEDKKFINVSKEDVKMTDKDEQEKKRDKVSTCVSHMCVCVRERERERDLGGEYSIMTNLQQSCVQCAPRDQAAAD